jgi:DNA-binding MarR family transcriptional regulator
LIKDVSRLYLRRFERRAEAFGLTLSQCRVLVHLAVEEGSSQVRLAELTDLEPMTLVRILDRMELEGWLERRIDPLDRRARQLYVTPKGKPLVDEIWRLVELTRREAFAGLSETEVAALHAALQAVRQNFLGLEPAGAAQCAAGDSGKPQVTRARRERGFIAP